MAARVIQVQNEDGILCAEVQYYDPLPPLAISREAKKLLSQDMKHAKTRVHESFACVFCHADSRFKTDIGPMCEHHLLVSTSWHEAVRI